MKAPIPIIAVPTPEARERFMRAAHAAGYTWGAGDIDSHVVNARSIIRYTHAYLVPTTKGRGYYFFCEGPEHGALLLETAALVNSPAHWIAYARRHFGAKQPS